MRLKSKRNESPEVCSNPGQSQVVDACQDHAPSHEDIRYRAYQIYLERGSLPGKELDDWAQAELELQCWSKFCSYLCS